MIDITEFSNLGKTKKQMLRDYLIKIHNTNDINQIHQFARHAFSIINIDPNTLFSSTKDFGKLGTTVKDAEAGIHVLRTWIAHEVQRARRWHFKNRSSRSETYDADGIVILENYFAENLVVRLEREIKKIDRAISKTHFNLVSHMREDNSAIREAVFGRTFGNISILKEHVFDCLAMSVTNQEARTQFAENTFVQRIHNKKGDGDVQKTMHQDTFFPCLKFWYFPKEVTLADGPLTYAPGSHVLTHKRLQWTYEQSIVIAKGEIPEARTYGHKEGSLRVSDAELTEMGLSARPYPVPRNTLVIANVFGFHRRSEVEQEGYRDSIHGSIRMSTPFGE